MLKRFFLSERNIMIAILINAAVIFSLYFPEIKEHNLLVQIDHFFVVFFLIEVIIKLFVYKPKKYFANKWNWFDFIIVVISLPSLFMAYLPCLILRLYYYYGFLDWLDCLDLWPLCRIYL